MTKFDQKQFNEFIIKQNVVGFFEKPITLKSGRISNWYVNWRNVAEDVFLLDKLTDYVINFIEDLELKPNCFYGVPEGATKLGILTQYKWAKKQADYNSGIYTLSMGRGKIKDHGDPKDKYFLGIPKGKIVLLEDVTTTGGSLLDTIDNLLEINVPIIAAIGLTNRNELRDDKKSVQEAVEKKGIPYYAMSNALDLLPEIYKNLQSKGNIAEIVEEYFEKYGVKKINLI